MAELTTTELVLTTCGVFGTIIMAGVGFGINRIFKKLDDIALQFGEIAEAFRKIYIDVHQADDRLWAQLGSQDKRIVRLETICKLKQMSCNEKEE